jgi:hypothetical protein
VMNTEAEIEQAFADGRVEDSEREAAPAPT